MQEVNTLAKILIFSGLLLVGVGLILLVVGKVPFFGKLPGDIYIQKKNFTFFFPLTTSIIISLILSIIIWLMRVNR